MLPDPIAELYANPVWQLLVSKAIDFLAPIYHVANLVGSALVIYYFSIYWKTRLRKIEVEAEIEKKIEAKFDWMKEAEKVVVDPRWARIDGLMKGASASDWRIAVLESDSILDDLIKKMGVPGADMGERMKGLVKSDLPLLDEAWRVHRLRNTLAHEAGYELTKAEAEEAVDTYHRIFKDMGFLPS